MKTSITRRTFLKGSLAATGLTIAVSVSPFGIRLLNASQTKDTLKGFKPNIWYEITPNNVVTVFIGSSEMGQGTHTALATVIADELEADWKQVKVRQGPAAKEYHNPLLGEQLTVASAAVRGFYEPCRKAAAAGRAMLVKAAAATWGVPESDCEANKGKVVHKKSNHTFTYGQICLEAAKLAIPKEPALKKESDFRFIGKPTARVDIPAKVKGTAVYGLDVSVPGMLYAVLARPPAYGAKPVSSNEKAALQVKGVVKVVETPMGLAVCAKSLETAWKGRKALDVKWDQGALPQLDNAFIEKTMMEELDKPGSKAAENGDAKKALEAAAKKVRSTYFVPYVAHALMEPINCTAYVQKDKCDVWAPTQGQTGAQGLASEISGLPPDKVHIHTTYMGCGLGRRAAPDFVVEAVIASKATGKPVKVVWTREEDIKYDLFRAATCQRIEAGVDGQGQLTGWSHKVVAGSIFKLINPKAIQNGIDIMSLWGLVDFPGSPDGNRILYEIPNLYLEFLISELPVPVTAWRSVQNGPNAFVTECFMDEMAHAAGKDPLEFRLGLLKESKGAQRVLKVAAEKAGWGKPLPKGQGRGIAQHHCFGTDVAAVAEVSVNEKDGHVKVNRVVVAVDCGLAVNPLNVEGQIQGGVINALSTALKEEVIFAKGGVKSANFEDYDILRMSEVPDIEVHLVKGNDKMGGIGEPGVPPTAPAVANAFFNATGVRIRRIPLTPEVVL
ncbi:MAG: xanthine dehydrogenase family protein molybdopterin-binding subunit, partial [Deltaproteobacteria bacterium]|nr:xanthine dehydrogenase family protein molybdopterin-binding subunit [Deltaproteobacteria bacterium]